MSPFKREAAPCFYIVADHHGDEIPDLKIEREPRDESDGTYIATEEGGGLGAVISA